MFTASFFIIAPKCTQAKCCVAGDGINKLCYIHTMKQHITVIRDGLLLYSTTWINLKNITPNIKILTPKNTYCTIPLMLEVARETDCKGAEGDFWRQWKCSIS